MKDSENPWCVYMVVCKDKTIYTGIARNLQKRLHEHNHGKAGAKYTRSRRPVRLVYHEEHPSRSAASEREHRLKKLTRTKKLQLITATSCKVKAASEKRKAKS